MKKEKKQWCQFVEFVAVVFMKRKIPVNVAAENTVKVGYAWVHLQKTEAGRNWA